MILCFSWAKTWVSPIKRHCQEKTPLHGKNIIFFLQDTLSTPGKSLFYLVPVRHECQAYTIDRFEKWVCR